MCQSSRWLPSSAASSRSPASSSRKAAQSPSPRSAPAHRQSYTVPSPSPRRPASRSGVNWNSGERSTANSATSCRGLSSTWSRAMATDTSVVPKNSRPPSADQGMDSSPRAAA